LPAPGPGENRLQFGPDGSFLAVLHPRRAQVQVWRLLGKKTPGVSEKPLLPVKVLDEPWRAWAICFSPDSLRVAFQQPDLVVGVFDLTTGKIVRRLAVDGVAQGFAFSPDGRQLAFATEDMAQVRDWQTDTILWQRRLSGVANWVEWHPNGKILAVGETTTNGDIISLWGVAADKLTAKLEGMQGSGIRCTFNHAGTLLASTGWAGVLRLWDPVTGRLRFNTFGSGMITPRFSPADLFLAGIEHDNRLRIWEIAAGDEYRTLAADRTTGDRMMYCSAVSADGRLLAAGAHGGAGLWDLQSRSLLAFADDSERVNFARFDPSGSLLTMGQNGLFRRPIRRDPKTDIVELGPPEKLPIPGAANAIAQSADGTVIASAQSSGAVVLHADQPERLIRLGPHEDARYVAVSPNGQWVATGGFGYPGGAKIWNARTAGKPVIDLPIGPNCWPVFSPDGKRLVVASGVGAASTIRMWAVDGWEEVPFPETVQGAWPAMSPDGKLLVVETSAGVAGLLDPSTGRELGRLEDPNQDRANHFAFSPDSTKLVSATSDGHCLHVWDLRAMRRQLAELGLDWHSP
jgi:eukaryotic-like serine/threonine-protein kinase